MVQELTREADALATEAETKSKMDLLVKPCVQNPVKNVKRIENEEKNIDGLKKKLINKYKSGLGLIDNLPNARSVKIVLRSVKSQGKVREFFGLLCVATLTNQPR